jgi:hypothetical protein
MVHGLPRRSRRPLRPERRARGLRQPVGHHDHRSSCPTKARDRQRQPWPVCPAARAGPLATTADRPRHVVLSDARQRPLARTRRVDVRPEPRISVRPAATDSDAPTGQGRAGCRVRTAGTRPAKRQETTHGSPRSLRRQTSSRALRSVRHVVVRHACSAGTTAPHRLSEFEGAKHLPLTNEPDYAGMRARSSASLWPLRVRLRDMVQGCMGHEGSPSSRRAGRRCSCSPQRRR